MSCAMSQAAPLGLGEGPASCPHTGAECRAGAGARARPSPWRGQPPPDSGEASLPSHLVDGGFQAAEADAELQPPQEVVRCSDQDMQLLVHEAIPGGGFGQTAPGRWKRAK